MVSFIHVGEWQGKARKKWKQELAWKPRFDIKAVHWSLYFPCALLPLPSWTWKVSILFLSSEFFPWTLSSPCPFSLFGAVSFRRFAVGCSSARLEPCFLFSREIFLELLSLWFVATLLFMLSCCNLNNCSSSRRGVTCKEGEKNKHLYPVNSCLPIFT